MGRPAPPVARRNAVRIGTFGLLLALVGLVSGCGGSDASSSDAADLTRGADVYAQKCAACHGPNLEGTGRGPSHLEKVYEPSHHPDEAFRAAIASGAPQHHWPFGPMPAIAMSETDADAVIAFIRSEQERQGFRE